MRVLVTGGAGYIGSHVAHRLISAQHEVVILDNLVTGTTTALPSGAEFFEGDVRDRVCTSQALVGVDAVIHLAGLRFAGLSFSFAELFRSVNAIGTEVLLEAMSHRQVDTVILSSSCSVYGDPRVLPVSEEGDLRPISPYGESKLQAEFAVRNWVHADGPFEGSPGRAVTRRAIALRYFNVGGISSGTYDRFTESLIPSLQWHFSQGLPFPLFGQDFPTFDGSALRDYIHVDDVVEAHLAALDLIYEHETGFHVYNLGRGNPSSVREVLLEFERTVSDQVKVDVRPRRHGDPIAVWADPSRARGVLGWSAAHDLGAIVSSAVHGSRLAPRTQFESAEPLLRLSLLRDQPRH